MARAGERSLPDDNIIIIITVGIWMIYSIAVVFIIWSVVFLSRAEINAI